MARPTNPYVHGPSITRPHQFFGRAQELRQLCAALERRESLALVGPRRIGKTSVLNMLGHRRIWDQYGADPDAVIVRRVNFQGRIGSSATPEDVYALFFRALTGQPPSPSDPLPEALEDELDTYGEVAFLLDEFETLVERVRDESCYDTLFSLLEGRCYYLMASAQPLPELAREGSFTSPFFEALPALPLGVLTPDEARQLIGAPAREAGWEMPVEGILELAGGHPFLLQLLSAGVFEHQGDLEAARPAFLDRARDHIRYWRSQLPPAARALVESFRTQPQQEWASLLAQDAENAARLVREGWLQQDGQQAWLTPCFADALQRLPAEALSARSGDTE